MKKREDDTATSYDCCGEHWTREVCVECNRLTANTHDEGNCNTGECGCEFARGLCWRGWNGGLCLPFSSYDPEHGPAMRARRAAAPAAPKEPQ